MEIYTHKVQYYETDKMGVTHHSNYIRWMEEARIDLLEQIGWDFRRIEAEGIVCPIINCECQYKKSTFFGDVISIEVKPEKIRWSKLKLCYEMRNEAGEVVCLGRSTNCFLDENGLPIKLEKKYPELVEAILNM